MTISTREQILRRITELAVSQAGFTSAVRNRGLRKNEQRPAIVVLDGDESPILTHGTRLNRAHNGRAMHMTSEIVRMRPEMYVLLEEKRATADSTAEIGPELSAKSAALIKAIAADELLVLLCGSNGAIIYQGTVTDLKSGMAMSGQARIDIDYVYTFNPTTYQQENS